MNFFSRLKSAVSSLAGKTGIFATFINFVYPFSKIDPKKYYTSWVFAAINAIAEQVATIEIKMQKKNSKGDWEDVKDHQSITVLKKVNSEMTSSQLFYSVPAWCESEGNAFWVVFYNLSGKPVEIWPYDSTKVIIDTDDNGMVSGYKLITGDGKYKQLNKEDVIHFKHYNIKDRLRGIGTIEAVRLEAETDTHAGEYNRNFFYNSAIPSAILETDQKLTHQQIIEISKQWNQKYQGPENAHKTGILHSGLKFKPTTVNQRDMQFLEQRRYSRDSIIAIFRVPPVILGIIEDANRANIEGAEYIFGKYRIKPYMDFIIDHLNEFYLPMWKLSQDEYRFALAKDPVPANEELMLKKKTAGYGKWITANEIRAEEGREPVEGGDVLADPNRVSNSMPQDAQGEKSKKKILIKKKDNSIPEGQQAILDKNEAKSAKEYNKFLTDTKKELLEKLKKAKAKKINRKFTSITELIDYRKQTKATEEELVKLLFEDWDKWVGILYDSIKDDYDISLAYGGKVALAKVGASIAFDIENERAQAWIADTALNHSKTIVGTLKDDLRPVIADAAKRGEGAQGVADAIQEWYTNISDSKALMLARTELCNGYSQGTLEGFRQSDVVAGKKWVTVEDIGDVCGENEARGAISLDEMFDSIWGDIDAPAAHPNCRCYLDEVLKKD